MLCNALGVNIEAVLMPKAWEPKEFPCAMPAHEL